MFFINCFEVLNEQNVKKSLMKESERDKYLEFLKWNFLDLFDLHRKFPSISHEQTNKLNAMHIRQSRKNR